MKTKVVVILAFVVLFALSLFASQTTVTGVLTDDMCTKKHMMPGKPNADCVRECIKHGAKYALVSGGKVYEIQGKTEKLGELAGKKVSITGELNGKVLVVSSATAAQ